MINWFVNLGLKKQNKKSLAYLFDKLFNNLDHMFVELRKKYFLLKLKLKITLRTEDINKDYSHEQRSTQVNSFLLS